jgi:hypothetical protein
VSNVRPLTREELEELERKSRELPELQSVSWRWDFANQRVTLSQKQSRLAIHPAEVTLTFDTLQLAFFILFKTGLELSGIMAQLGPVSVSPSGFPSGGPSDPPRSQPLPPGQRLL